MMRIIKKIIKGFYYTYMSLIGCGCSTIIVLILFLIIVGYKSSDDILITPHRAQQGGMLAIDLSSRMVEMPTNHGAFINFLNDSAGHIGTLDMSEKIKCAASDTLINGIVVYGSLSGSGNSFAQAAALRAWLEEFKLSGKPVFAYLENPTQGDYYVASAATRIYANPAGIFEFKGMIIKSLFIGDALKKYGVEAELIRAGKYKSAGEIFTSDKFSQESRKVYSEIAEGLWKTILADISASRKIPVETLEKIASQKALISAPETLKLRLADVVCPRDEFIKHMSDISGEYGSSFRQISIQDYIAINPRDTTSDSIAVLFLSGEIIDGNKRMAGYISSGYYAPIIRELRMDDAVKGVVLRIDSPGGSAYASEILRREIELLANTKPVVASYGATAASGAYWISAGAEKIIAQKNTLTGSIGVFGMVLSANNLAGNFGLTFDSVETSPLADIMSGTRKMTDAEREIIQEVIDQTYENFIKIVQDGRNLERTKVEEIAQGRVWLASEAKETGLFDEIGGLDRAIEVCTKLAEETPQINIRQYPRPERLFDLLNEMQTTRFANIKKIFLPKELAQTLQYLAPTGPIRAQMQHIPTVEY